MKPFTSKHCTPLSYGSPLKQTRAAREGAQAYKDSKTKVSKSGYGPQNRLGTFSRLENKIEETKKKAFIRSNSPYEDFESSPEEGRAQKKLKRLNKRLVKKGQK
jgi:hypothetical protein